MFDNGSLNRGVRTDQHAGLVRADSGFETALMLRRMALLGIAARLFLIFAGANRISFSHTVLGMVGANGQLNVTDQSTALGLEARGNDADSLVTAALVVSVVVMVLFILTWVSLSRRKKRGDALAAAVDKNRAIRLASRLYLVAAIATVAVRDVFTTGPGASSVDRLRAVLHGDAANIGLQIVVIAFLLIVALATGREIAAARAGGRTGYEVGDR